MGDIDDYSRSALERSGKCITRYSRVEYDGYIQINYQVKDRVEGAVIGGCCGFLAGAGACAYFVPGVGIVAATLLTATATGAGGGAYVGTHYDYTVYFDIQTVVIQYLGRDRDVARRKVSERRRQKKEKDKIKLASENYSKATTAWEEGWKAESSGQSDEATKKFQEGYELYTSASNFAPDNSKYTLGKQKCKDKIDGNTLFNEGLELQEKANRFKQEEQYKKALELYEQAKAKFCEGFQNSQDKRFHDCENIVNECINGIKTALERQKITNSMAALNFNDQVSNNEKQKTNLQNHLYNQVSMMLDVKRS